MNRYSNLMILLALIFLIFAPFVVIDGRFWVWLMGVCCVGIAAISRASGD